METESLSTTARRRAGLAIENTFREYTKSGGLKDRERQKDEAEQKCSTYIFGLAQFAAEHRPKKHSVETVFDALCKYAEAQFKEKHEVTNVETVLPVWKVFKSNILRGIRAGLDPQRHATEWEFRKATAQAFNTNIGQTRPPSNKAPLTRREIAANGHGGGYGNGHGGGNGATGTASEPAARPFGLETAEDLLEPTTIRPNLKGLLARLVIEAEYVKAGAEQEAAKVLNDAFVKLAGLVDRRRIRDNATKEALRAALH